MRGRVQFAINQFSPWLEPLSDAQALYTALDKADDLVQEAYRDTLVGNDRVSFLKLVRLVFFARTYLRTST